MVVGNLGNRNTVSPFFVLEHFEKAYFSIFKKEIFFLISIFQEALPYLFQSSLIIINVCFYNKTSLKATNAVLYTRGSILVVKVADKLYRSTDSHLAIIHHTGLDE